jgi:metal-responsive CopG/Arc/MetJ family transcriptional regulator
MNNESLKNVTVQIEPSLLEKIDSVARQMDLNRSQYLRRLMRKAVADPMPAEPQQAQPQEVAA